MDSSGWTDFFKWAEPQFIKTTNFILFCDPFGNKTCAISEIFREHLHTLCERLCFLHPDTADRMLASLTRTVWTKLMVPDETAYNIAVDTAGQHAKATDKKKFQEQNLYPKNNLVTQLFCCRWCNLSSKSVLITFVHLNAWYGFLIFFVIRNC